MKDVGLLVGLFIVLLFALFATRQSNPRHETPYAEERSSLEEWQVVNCELIDEIGEDTVVVLQTMVRRHAE